MPIMRLQWALLLLASASASWGELEAPEVRDVANLPVCLLFVSRAAPRRVAEACREQAATSLTCDAGIAP